MKTATVLIVGSFLSTFLIIGMMLALYASDPEVFTGPMPAVKSDTTVAATPETLQTPAAQHDISPSAPVVRPAEKSQPVVRTENAAADSTDWRSKAKLFEAMSVESASSILQTMNDKEVRQIIPHIKKRNAAKILALFDPDRAARIIR